MCTFMFSNCERFQKSIMFYSILIALAIWSVNYTIVTSAPTDNVVDVVDYILNGMVELYAKKGGKVVIPDIGKAKHGSFGDLSQITKKEGSWGRIGPVNANPRRVTFKFRLIDGVVEFTSLKRKVLTKKQALQLDLSLKFTSKVTVEVNESDKTCKVNFGELRIKGMPGELRLNGKAKPVEKDLAPLADQIRSETLEIIRNDVEATMKEFIGDGFIDCSLYEPSKQFTELCTNNCNII